VVVEQEIFQILLILLAAVVVVAVRMLLNILPSQAQLLIHTQLVLAAAELVDQVLLGDQAATPHSRLAQQLLQQVEALVELGQAAMATVGQAELQQTATLT
jgi:hypothetical protein